MQIFRRRNTQLSPNIYHKKATELAPKYLSKPFEEVHKSLSQCLPSIIKNPNARILDVGVGAGRDAKRLTALATKTHNTKNNSQTLATKPAKAPSQLRQNATQGLNTAWLKDRLPALSNITKQEVSADLILLSAVSMHIPMGDHACLMRKHANIYKPGSKIEISLLHRKTDDECKQRKMHHVYVDKLT